MRRIVLRSDTERGFANRTCRAHMCMGPDALDYTRFGKKLDVGGRIAPFAKVWVVRYRHAIRRLHLANPEASFVDGVENAAEVRQALRLDNCERPGGSREEFMVGVGAETAVISSMESFKVHLAPSACIYCAPCVTFCTYFSCWLDRCLFVNSSAYATTSSCLEKTVTFALR